LPLKIDKWDSSFFKVPVARLSLDKPVRQLAGKLSDLLDSAREGKVRFMVLKLAGPAIRQTGTVLEAGFKERGSTVDHILKNASSSEKTRSSEVKIKMFKPEDTKAVKNIANDAFRLSYLYRCGFGTTQDIDRYHVVWIKNIMKDRNSKIFVAKKDGRVVGFSAVKVDPAAKSGRIILIAVHKKYRGMGIGDMLTQRCIEWGRKNLKKMFVKSQASNKKALSLYKKSGFKVISRDKVFCKKFR